MIIILADLLRALAGRTLEELALIEERAMNIRLFFLSLVLLLAAFAAGVLITHQQAGAQQQVSLADMSTNASDWVMPGQDYANQRYSELDQITPDNVKNLKVAW
ncbi:MAG TPA: hypothetical protein VFN37_04380, partial [Candidatus Baltobacteraceae bacterium]|nr:hypothetical protein [Candidatus Baltobacteraceae bacterium]